MKEKRQVFLTTKNLDLVLLTVDDASTFARWFNTTAITQFLGRGDFPMTEESEVEYLEKLYKDKAQLQLGIYHRKDKRLIGTTGIHQISDRDLQGSFGIMIGEPEYWGGGYGTETLQTMLDWGFNIRGLRIVTLRVLENNPRGRHCYEKCGFVQVGTIPKSTFKVGEWVDEYIMIAVNPQNT